MLSTFCTLISDRHNLVAVSTAKFPSEFPHNCRVCKQGAVFYRDEWRHWHVIQTTILAHHVAIILNPPAVFVCLPWCSRDFQCIVAVDRRQCAFKCAQKLFDQDKAGSHHLWPSHREWHLKARRLKNYKILELRLPIQLGAMLMYLNKLSFLCTHLYL